MRVKVKFTDGTKAHFEIRPWCTVKDLKDQIFQAEQIPANVQRIFRRGVELRNNWPLTLAEEGAVFFCTHRAASTRQSEGVHSSFIPILPFTPQSVGVHSSFTPAACGPEGKG